VEAYGGCNRYQKINILFFSFFLFTFIITVFKGNYESSVALASPLLLFSLFNLILFIIGDKPTTRRIQTVYLFFIASFVIVTNSVVYQVGYLLFIFVYFLSKKYNVFTSKKVVTNITLIILLFASISISVLSYTVEDVSFSVELNIWHVLNHLAFLFTTIILIFIVFEDDIKRLTLENQKLNTEIEKSRVFVNLGENISGLIHNMNGDLGLMSMSVSMLEEEVEHKAVEFVRKGNKNLQAKIRNILTLAKYSQAEDDMEFSINALLYSLLEVFNINKKFRIVTTRTDFRDEVFFFGNPSEVSQVFENLLKNAYEALVEQKKNMDEQGNRDYNPALNVKVEGHSEKSLVLFSDNGPGIKACLERNCNGDCGHCHAFKIGRTTKEQGTGLGMVSVMRTLQKYNGTMKIRTSVEGTNIEVTLPRG